MRGIHEKMPLRSHKWTVIALHGFNSNGEEFCQKMECGWRPHVRDHARLVFLTAPLRRISCYGNDWYRSWHNYYTSYGDDGVECEEEIDTNDLHETRQYVRNIVDIERRLTRHVILLGESQGACCAIDAGMQLGVPVIALYGQRYVHTPLRANSPIFAFWGGRDTVISPRLAMPSLKGATLTHHTASACAHAETGPELWMFMNAALNSITSA